MNKLLHNELREKLKKWPENKNFNPIINPITGYKIKENGPTYKIIEKKYKELFPDKSNDETINMENVYEDFNEKLNIEDSLEEFSEQQNILNKLDKELDDLFTSYGL